MAAPSTVDEFLELIGKSGLLDEDGFQACVRQAHARPALDREPDLWGRALVRAGLLTHFQAEQLLRGRWHGFRIGKYRVLERLGSGGGGNVFLCEHQVLHHKVAVKVLAHVNAEDPTALTRFYREARAGAVLRHPNIVSAYDIDQEDKLHFLVMDYVDGSSLREVATKFGPMDVTRAAHYVRQAAGGLRYAHQAGVIHRDVNPGNLLLDRQGTVKILDLGVARFVDEAGSVLSKNVMLGTADYLSPEQALDSHAVDRRADLYSLGATFYHLLAGRPPFAEAKTIARKLLCHQTQEPPPIRGLRPEVPEGLTAVVERMIAKEPDRRYQTASEVIEALAPWTRTPIPAPPKREMPRLSPAAANGTRVKAGWPEGTPPSPAPLPDPGAAATTPSPENRLGPAGDGVAPLPAGTDTALAGPPAAPASAGGGSEAAGTEAPVPAAARPPTLAEATQWMGRTREGQAESGHPHRNGTAGKKTGLRPRLVVLRGREVGAEYPIHEGENLIGRSGKLPVDIDLAAQEDPEHFRASRYHALLTFDDGGLLLEDLGSPPGTFVNRMRLPSGEKRPVHAEDVIQMGTVQVKVTF